MIREPIIDRILHAFGVGRIRLNDDSGPVQRLQVDEGKIGPDGGARLIDKVIKMGHFGFVSSAPIDSEVLLIRLGGLRSQTMVIGTNHQDSRLKDLPPGDAAMHDVRGAYIWLTENGIVIDGAGLPITVQNFGTATFHGDVHVTGDVVSRSAGTPVSLNDLRDKYNAHTHDGIAVGTDSTGTTDEPE